MNNKTDLEKLPSRIKYYLLEWKDKNMAIYVAMYPEKGLNKLTTKQLKALFRYATNLDIMNLDNKNIVMEKSKIRELKEGVH